MGRKNMECCGKRSDRCNCRTSPLAAAVAAPKAAVPAKATVASNARAPAKAAALPPSAPEPDYKQLYTELRQGVSPCKGCFTFKLVSLHFSKTIPNYVMEYRITALVCE